MSNGNQPEMSGWNLARFAETLLRILHEESGQKSGEFQISIPYVSYIT